MYSKCNGCIHVRASNNNLGVVAATWDIENINKSSVMMIYVQRES